MPIYEYRCETCGAISEYLVGAGEIDSIRCKNCGGSEMSRILSAAAVISQSASRMSGRTCCGREERCATPPCTDGGACRRV